MWEKRLTTQPVKAGKQPWIEYSATRDRVVTRRKPLFLIIVTLATAYCVWSAFWVWAGWSICCGGFFTTPLWLVVGATAIATFNVLGLIAFVTHHRTWGAAALTLTEVGNLLFSLFAAFAFSLGWLLTDAAPALILLGLVLAFVRAEAGGGPERSG